MRLIRKKDTFDIQSLFRFNVFKLKTNKSYKYRFNVIKKSSCDHRELWNSLRMTCRSIITGLLHPLVQDSSKEG